MLAHGIALTQTNGERLNHMKIYPTYTCGDWVKGTVVISGTRQYYAGGLECMRQLSSAYYSHELGNATRIKPYVHLPHIQI